MLRRIAEFFTVLTTKYLPDAYVFAIILTFIVFLVGMILQSKSPVEMATYWGNGFWNLLTFSMQMVLILVSGFTLAKTELIQKFLQKLAGLPKNPRSAVFFTALVSAIACWFNWGFGLVIGALLCTEVAKKVKGIHFGLLVASAYSGFLVWHSGLSGSIPLKVATADGFMGKFLNNQPIPVSETIFSTQSLVLSIILILSLPVLNMLMHPSKDNVVEATVEVTQPKSKEDPIDTPTHKLEHSPIISILLFLLGGGYLLIHFSNGGSLGLDIINLVFLFFAILLHKSPRKFLDSFSEGVSNSSGIILQFPFYAGIMGMMKDSGIATSLSEFFVSISTAQTFPLLTYFSAGIINFFVPSGGGQWAVQGPIMIPAAQELGVPVAKTAMAIAWGDAWTNMLQPFWALPILSLCKAKLSDMMGFCVISFIWSGFITGLALLLF